MLVRAVITSAVAIYLAIMGIVLATRPADAPTDAVPIALGPKLEGLPLRGVALTIIHVDNLPAYIKCIDEIAATGADTVEFVVSARQENGTSSSVFLDLRMTPTRDQLLELCAYAKKKNLRVMLMPIVLLQNPRGNEWRGTLKPDLWAEWFDSYRAMMQFYADVARDGKVDVMVVGSELVSTEVHGDEWTKTIKMIRSKFPGYLTYSANWDHYANIPFWDQLDFIGMNSYWKLGENNKVSVEEIQKRWRDIQKELTNFSNKKAKPIILCEVGWCSLSNAADEPWDYTRTDKNPDWDLQKRLYEGFFKSWQGNPNLGGFMVWEWTPYPVAADDRSYTPKTKPAYDVLKDWFSKGRWEVK